MTTDRSWRRKVEPGRATVGPVALYLEDLEDLLEALAPVARAIYIEDRSYEYGSLGAIQERVGARPFDELHLKAVSVRNAGSVLEISIIRSGVTVTWPTEASDLDLAGAAHVVLGRLRDREARGVGLELVGALLFLAVAGAPMAILVPVLSSPIGLSLFLAGALGAGALASLAQINGARRRSRIYVVYQREIESTWSKYRDVLIAISAAAAGAVVTLVGTWLITNSRPPGPPMVAPCPTGRSSRGRPSPGRSQRLAPRRAQAVA